MNIKQVIVLRKDLNMRKGKMVAQGAHASVQVSIKLYSEIHDHDSNLDETTVKNFLDWINGLQTKVCVGVSSEQELGTIYAAARSAGLPCSIITDAGKTEFGGVPTKTAVAIGPAEASEIDKITGHLSLL